ncbi:arylesterase [Salinisphaera sp. Q1T1-3]|uniref:arylesterase n=1 Tax=Salinisphaera sp. Q1T1-3 TaxID=2321229 RepID=UPI000E73CF80|nr:arylesterase [Salinisphaera sp. Q1T1-3]RJS93480.1 arylesterase [Salinisphaera sp. Q1T1-3]
MTTILLQGRGRLIHARCIAAWVLLLCAWSVAGTAAAAPTVLVFGDSLSAAHGMAQSQGWVALMRKRLAQSYPGTRVVNASVSGETTAGGRERFDAALRRAEPDIVVLELGGNDGLQVLDTRAMHDNLAAMIEAAQHAGARVLLLGMRIPPNFGPVYTTRFHAVFESLAQQYDVAYDPFFLAPIADDRSHFQSDGIHPTAAVQPVLAKRVIADLQPLLSSAHRQGDQS